MTYLQLNFIVSVLRFLIFDMSSRIFNFDFQILQVNETKMSENEKGRWITISTHPGIQQNRKKNISHSPRSRKQFLLLDL